jgi:alpha-D-xyloside xylohydrolase
VMRAMPLAFPDDPDTWQHDTQYLLGPSLLVAPAVRAGGRVRIGLPEGRWFELATGEWLEGGRTIERDVPLNSIPLFGREGHLLPLGPVVQHTGELPAPLTVEEVLVFGAPSASLDLPVTDGDGVLVGTVTLGPTTDGAVHGLEQLALPGVPAPVVTRH